jgi:hypothetical protein
MGVTAIRRLKELEDEDGKQKRLAADLTLDGEAFKPSRVRGECRTLL